MAITTEILVVEDDPALGDKIKKFLSKHKNSVTLVQDGESALSIMQKKTFALVLLDLILPGMDGEDVIKAIRKKYNPVELPVCVISVKTNKIHDLLAIGANEFLDKPVSLELLQLRVINLCLASDFHKIKLKEMERKVVESIVITYNHHINTPLAVAKILVSKLIKECPKEDLTRLKDSLDKISQINTKLRTLLDDDIKYEQYTEHSTMIKLE
jgi:DNA-binding response OmpR family regulator